MLRTSLVGILVAVTGCVTVNTSPQALARVPQLRKQFAKLVARSQPGPGVSEDEFATAKRAFESELKQLGHDLAPGFVLEEAGYDARYGYNELGDGHVTATAGVVEVRDEGISSTSTSTSTSTK